MVMTDLLTWLNGFERIGGPVVQALGTILAAAFGAFIGVGTWIINARGETRREQRQIETQQAAELTALRKKSMDLVRALHAEIVAGVSFYGEQTTDNEVAYSIDELSPFATPDDTDFVFDNVQGDLTILPSQVIHAVVAYYRVQKQLNLMIADFRSEQFLAQDKAAKAKYMEGYIRISAVLVQRGRTAIKLLEDHAPGEELATELRTQNARLVAETKDITESVTKQILEVRRRKAASPRAKQARQPE